MKKLFLLSALAASCAVAENITQSCGNDTSKIEPTMFSFALLDGDTTSDIRQPFSLERIECAFMFGGSFKLERVRSLDNVPYIDHRTNDGAVVDWKITSGTTFDSFPEAFRGPLKKRSGGYSAECVDSPYYAVLDDGGTGTTLQFYGGYTRDSEGNEGYAPCVFYSFASNALYLAEVSDRPDLWTYFGTPGKPGIHSYVRDLNVYDYQKWQLVHSGDAIVSVKGEVTSTDWESYPVTNVTQESYQIGGGTHYRYVTNVTWETRAVYNGGEPVEFVTNWLNETAFDPLNRYSDIVFSRFEMPEELATGDGSTIPVSLVRGHVVTNFAVWSTCSMMVTDTLVSTNADLRLDVSLKDVFVLPKDVLRVSGSAMPTGHVIGIGRK